MELTRSGHLTGDLTDKHWSDIRRDWLILDDAVVSDSELNGGEITNLMVGATTVRSCTFSAISVEAGVLGRLGTRQSCWYECTLLNCNLRSIDFGQAYFERCRFQACEFSSDTDVRVAEFVNCEFVGDVKDLVFFGRIPRAMRHGLVPARKGNRFVGNNFVESRLIGTSFTQGIDLGAQQLPTDEAFVLIRDWKRASKLARRAIRKTDASGSRDGMLLTLQVWDDYYRDQKSVFLSRLRQDADTVKVIDALERAQE